MPPSQNLSSTQIKACNLKSCEDHANFWLLGTQWGPYGNVSQTSTFVWEFGPDMGLLYFTGKAFVYLHILCWRSNTDLLVYRNDYIRQLSATFGKYIHHQQVTSVVTYEKQINTTPNTQRPVVLSKFSQ